MSYKTIGIGNTTQHNVGSISSGSFSHTVVTGSDRKLILLMMNRNTGAITSVTANGSSMTLAKQSTSFDGCFTQIFYLDNPDVGSNTISYTLNGTDDNRAVIGVLDIRNAKQGTITRTDEQVGGSYGFTNSVTVDVSGSIVIEGQFNTGIQSGTVGAGQSYIATRSGNDSGGASYKANVNAGTTNMSWSWSDSDSAYSEAVVVIEPAKQKGGAFIYNLI